MLLLRVSCFFLVFKYGVVRMMLFALFWNM